MRLLQETGAIAAIYATHKHKRQPNTVRIATHNYRLVLEDITQVWNVNFFLQNTNSRSNKAAQVASFSKSLRSQDNYSVASSTFTLIFRLFDFTLSYFHTISSFFLDDLEMTILPIYNTTHFPTISCPFLLWNYTGLLYSALFKLCSSWRRLYNLHSYEYTFLHTNCLSERGDWVWIQAKTKRKTYSLE